MKSKLVEHPKRAGEMITVFEGRTAAEDSRWILITALKPNSTKDYLCLACGKAFTGYDGRVVNHKLRLKGNAVEVCLYEPSEECRDVLERVIRAKRGVGIDPGKAGGKTPSATTLHNPRLKHNIKSYALMVRQL